MPPPALARSSPAVVTPSAALSARRRWRLPTLREVWFQLHWFVGITAGTLLAVIGLTGAILAFEDEIVEALNPGVFSVAPEQRPRLGPEQILLAAQQARPGMRVASLTFKSEADSSASVRFAPPPGERRGPEIHIHPYSGALLPAARGEAFFQFVDSTHRWLLLPRAPGRIVLGILALCLVGLALSGLYLRWPRNKDWRSWLTFNTKLRGRSFLWALHAIAGTWALVAYLVVAGTGLYWSFDIVRGTLQDWAGTPSSQPREGRSAAVRGEGGLAPAWQAFVARAPDWSNATIRLPERGSGAYQLTWVAQDAPHDRARNRMTLGADGTVRQDERHADMSTGQRALSTIRPLHTGTYFGLPGRIVMMLASLALPGFAITGWMLYLGRRRQKRALARERSLAAQAGAHTSGAPVLVAFATQGGQAERIALHSAAALRAGGRAVDLRAVSALAPGDLAGYGQALFVASTFGEGEAPDAARRFSRELEAWQSMFDDCRFAVLALGDRNYAQFCGYGHALQLRLLALGGAPLFPLVEVDQGDPVALARWMQALGGLGAAAGALPPAAEDAAFSDWVLHSRRLLNPGSLGAPLYDIALRPAADARWQPGDLIEVAVPAAPSAPRRYSIASVQEDGAVELLVRQQRYAQGLGLASGWLTEQMAIGQAVQARLVANPGFHAPVDDVPCIYIGNGSGMAGLRGHLRGRAAMGRRRNWLLFGERQRAIDSLCEAELAVLRAEGMLPELDLAFSRDPGPEYVQDRLHARADLLRQWIDDGAVIHVCGSLQGMAGAVHEALVAILGQALVERLMDTGRYRRDVY
ncbi:sulfite reductase flavoprotein subunit alpha [Telluria beijingensis]|uniref:sulfite reductase flavoprotein subunit alpha n=1 Tax=Telluria beijingensis TaxID=3068633 RepID=UPI0027959AF3|nr:sulfite reductase flavoprotein subunit alpha [Massilia sp. REN29]